MRARRLALAALAAALGVALFLLGSSLDRAPYAQRALWGAIQTASLGGAALGLLANGLLVYRSALQRALGALLALAVWRLVYFPLMVFSGHVASVGEWVLASLGLPIFVFGVFLLVIGALHAGVGAAAGQLLAPFHRGVYVALPLAFALACAVSFSKASDLTLLPDRFSSLDAPVPPPVEPGRNPYLPRLLGPGYAPHQRVMLLAAGLTYETIPPSPWGRTVKAVLEVLFEENRHASTADRVKEHYLAYASAHPLIGCARFEDCAVEVGEAPYAP
jgi:hypothetical protein